MDTLAEQIRFAREQAGFAQNQAAEILEVSTVWLCNIENGHRNPSIDLLARISELYDVTFEVNAENVVA